MNRLLPTLILMLISSPILAQAQQCLMWEAKKEGQRPIVLFGTIHMGVTPAEVDAEVWRRLKVSDLVVTEIDTRDAAKLQATAIAHAQLPQGSKGLDELLGAERLAKLAKMIGAPPQALVRIQPFFLNSQLMATWSGHKGPSIDADVIRRATEAKKSLDFVETMEQQLGFVLGKISPKQWAEQLAETIDDPAKAKAEFAKMVAAYRKADAKDLATQISSGFGKDETLRKIMLDNRNVAWVPKLETWSKDRAVFLAVGSGHLIGKNSVNALLTARGWTVTRIGKAKADAPKDAKGDESTDEKK